jgi:Putative Flp pilus-assembly TadE/G-like
MTSLRNERGQAAAFSVLFLAALLGMMALVLDVGSWFREQRDTQSAADAAALAAVQALPEDPAQADTLAAQYLAKNRGGTADVTYSTKFAANDTVKVHVSRKAPGFFAKLFGIDSVDVGASATARATGLEAARWVAPIVVNIKHPQLNCGEVAGRPVPCFGEPTELTLDHLHKPGDGDAAGAFALINLNRADSGSVGGSTLGGWIENGFDEYMPLGDYTSVPSAQFNDSHVRDALTFRNGDTLLFPIYKTIKGSGTVAVYDVVGWVGFNVSGYKIGGDEGKVYGAFTKVIWEGIQSGTGSNLNYGVRTIALVD